MDTTWKRAQEAFHFLSIYLYNLGLICLAAQPIRRISLTVGLTAVDPSDLVKCNATTSGLLVPTVRETRQELGPQLLTAGPLLATD